MISEKDIADFADEILGSDAGSSPEDLADPETGALTMGLFRLFVQKEISRAQRYSRMFSLTISALDNVEALEARHGEETRRLTELNLAGAINAVIRDSDVMAQGLDRCFYMLLPETDYLGSRIYQRRIVENFNRREYIKELAENQKLSIARGTATFPSDGRNTQDLIDCALRRLDASLSDILERLKIPNSSFWGAAQRLLGQADHYARLRDGSLFLHHSLKSLEDSEGTIRHCLLSSFNISRLEEEILRETGRKAGERAIIYLGRGKVTERTALLKTASLLEGSASRVYLLLSKKTGIGSFPGVTPIFIDDPVIGEHRFVLYLTERSGYALLCRANQQGEFYGFHTNDRILIEDLMVKLQETYSLRHH